jgi:DIE2/ALG10 family
MNSGSHSLTILPQRLGFVFAVALLYLAIFYASDGLSFDPQKDEIHFWQTSLRFSENLIPTLDHLRSYSELNTPLPFMVFGTMEYFFHGGIRAGRLLNMLLSFAIVCVVGLPRSSGGPCSVITAFGLLLFPYYLGVSVHLYTDVIATFFVLLGMVEYWAGKSWISALWFILAIASRQYMVAFPVAITFYEFTRPRPDFLIPRAEWVAPLLAASSIFSWILLFGGLAPSNAVEAQSLSTGEPLRVFPSHALYLLSTVGVYFVALELVLFWRHTSAAQWISKRNVWIASVLAGLFLAFPPLQNVEYPILTMGFLDKAARTVMNDPLRLVLFYILALATCLRFNRYGLGAVLVYVNAVTMFKAHIGWDKYALPILVVLWHMKANGTLEPLAQVSSCAAQQSASDRSLDSDG